MKSEGGWKRAEAVTSVGSFCWVFMNFEGLFYVVVLK